MKLISYITRTVLVKIAEDAGLTEDEIVFDYTFPTGRECVGFKTSFKNLSSLLSSAQKLAPDEGYEFGSFFDDVVATKIPDGFVFVFPNVREFV